ncbi:MAG: peptidoglycan-binding domain-containing protein [bacterium]
MKKTLIIAGLFALLLSPSSTFAQQTDASTSGLSDCAIITSDLHYGDRDSGISSNVSMLQDFLNSNGYLKAIPNGFFGKMTLSAVKRFQSDNGITPTGVVGSFTRAKIQSIDCGGTTTTSSQTSTTQTAVATPTVSSSSNNGMSLSQANALVSSLGITGAQAQALLYALTRTTANPMQPIPVPAVNCGGNIYNTSSANRDCGITATATTTTITNTSSVINPFTSALTKNSAFANQNINANSIHQKIGSYVFINNQTGLLGINVLNLGMDASVPSSNFTNVSVYQNGVQVGQTIQTLSNQNVLNTNITVQIGQTVVFDVYADTGSAYYGYFNTALGVSGSMMYSNLPSPFNTGMVLGQTISFNNPLPSTFINISKNVAFANQPNVAPGTVHQKIGSYTVQNNSSSNNFNVSKILVGMSGNVGISNLSIVGSNGVQYGTSIVSPTSMNTLSVSTTISAGQMMTYDIFADIANTSGYIITSSQVDGYDSVSNLSVSTGTISGQTIYVGANVACSGESMGAASRVFTMTKNSTYGDQSFVSGSTKNKIASYTFTNNTCEDWYVNQTKIGLVTSVPNAEINNLSIYTANTFRGATSYFNSFQTHKDSWTIDTTIPKGQSVTVDMFADFPSTANGTYQMTFSPTATGKDTNTSISPASDIVGQIITVSPKVVSDGKSCDLDLVSGTNTCTGIASVAVLSQQNGQGLVSLNLDPSVSSGNTKVKFDVTFGSNTPDGWNVDIGNSLANDGYGGGNGQNTNTAELNVISHSVNSSWGFYTFGNDSILYHPTDSIDAHLLIKKIETQNNPLTGKTISFTVGDKSLGYDFSAANSESNVLQNQYLYDLGGQNDFDTNMPSPKTFYAAFNRVVNGRGDRVGTGVTKVHITLQ